LFEPFRQRDARLSQSHEGTGLWLAITRRLLEQHGGRIAIESKLGAGTVVTLLFPTFRLLLEDDLKDAINMS
jgi:signal transduction histidine kinase